MRTDELDFHLPPELIAQEPPAERHGSRLLHYNPVTRSIAHRAFTELPSLLGPGDLLVFNNTRVIPARFMLRKLTGGQVEGLFIRQNGPGDWNVLLRNVGPSSPGMAFRLEGDESVIFRLVERVDGGEFRVSVDPPIDAAALLDRIGRMPLPPYIKRHKGHDDRDDMDRARYQTVFAQQAGSVAAPTAALHFSPAILEELEARGVRRAFVTLNVGMGTFKPVSADTLEAHAMHTESYTLSSETAEAINQAKAEDRRVIAVGTTSTRVLESQPAGPIAAATGETAIFIYPPYAWKHVDALVTNFHLPRSTLIALVAAKIGLDEQRRIYAEAIRERYRFFSYGDAMFVG
ncbi:tRNA preQ1(34) S-adenosylmethionine ribosyltransferase-isomerase QueA [Humisphaera borealis]|uniref:S-adenosylmethionine:tRNA ribosyltransferase-isomerase n=1 Tax=Humisphaera borealis TaxID=2807512 RepID=A0A7M2WPU9_9BACT|nr:tRNA preQ1(34) S-adenosylmethionine ribosyltransferase-isomerase QueA [Humisphaera borealis]QOV87443.1 tRNA preQ1(34) S-adenosylmethionine ribosyltransferase-isomerase QueA [Humisphaera borealis]